MAKFRLQDHETVSTSLQPAERGAMNAEYTASEVGRRIDGIVDVPKTKRGTTPGCEVPRSWLPGDQIDRLAAISRAERQCALAGGIDVERTTIEEANLCGTDRPRLSHRGGRDALAEKPTHRGIIRRTP